MPAEPSRPRSSRAGAIWLIGALLTAEAGLLWACSHYSDLAGAGNPMRFGALLLLAGLVYLAALPVFEKVPQAHRPRVFWLAAIALRLAALAMEPGDDLWRYIWEGRVQLAGESPYALAPDAPALEGMRDATWALINHRDWAAIYPPGAQILFARLAAISATPLCFKLAFAFADLVTLFLLLRLNTGSGRFRACAWYAWNPAVACFLTGAAHYDSTLILALVAAIWALHRANPMNRGVPAWSWSVLSATFLGLAISLKAIPVFLLPVWVVALRGRSVVLGLTLLIPLALTLPYGGPFVVTESLRSFVQVTRFNDLFWWVVDPFWANPEERNGRYIVTMVIVVLAVTLWLRNEWRRAALWTLGAILILSPVLHPWYALWILPVAAWRKQHAWFILSLSAPLALLAWEATPWWEAWTVSWSLHLAVVIPPLAALAWQSWHSRSNDEPRAA